MDLGHNCEFELHSVQTPEKVVEMQMTTNSLLDPFELGFKGLNCIHQTDLSPYGIGILEAHVIHHAQDQSDAGFSKLATRLSHYDGGSHSEIVSSLDLFETRQTTSSISPPCYASHDECCIRKNSETGRNWIVNSIKVCEGTNHGATIQEDHPILDERIRGQTPMERKRKRVAENHTVELCSQFDATQSIEVKQQKNVSHATVVGPKGKDEKKLKSENPASNARKLTGKQVEDHSPNGDAPKQDYAHLRAKRGQATNSHSLAERVRRERISERMKFLQDLVPGCNKITGKAVMLDEIINYVQSMQRQVEFLSMKLATVNPKLNFDPDQILSNDILNAWDNDLQSSTLVQMGFVANPPPNGLEKHGHMKVML